MASSSSNSNIPLSTFVDQFVIDIHNICNNDTPVRIRVFKVPESLSASKPEAYFPQKVGLGLLHHNRSEIGAMQMYKLDVARRAHKAFGGIKFGELIEQLMKQVPFIRASYPTYLSYNDSAIAYIMAVDGLFLFKLLSNFFASVWLDHLYRPKIVLMLLPDHHDHDLTPPDILLNLVKREDARLDLDEMILRDTVMLENQIPLFVLKAILHMECSEKQSHPAVEDCEFSEKLSPAVVDCVNRMLCGYCMMLSPFDVDDSVGALKAIDGDHDHLLAFLYQLIMRPPIDGPVSSAFLSSSILEVLGGLLTGLLGNIGTLIDQVIRVVPELPWSEIFQRKAQVTEDILIPTASHLCAAKVKFSSAHHITAISFNREDTELWLPTIKVGVNSEVVIRNLVAYEAMSKSEDEPLLFARYIELMSGIIKAADDVKLLRDQGIIDRESVEDEDVVKVFSGMSKPVRVIHPKKKKAAKDDEKTEKAAKGLEKAIREEVKIFSGMCKPAKDDDRIEKTADRLEEVIRDVNKYYIGLRRVKAHKIIKKLVSTLWQMRSLFAAILLLSLVALQTYCSVFGCSRISNKFN